MDFSNEITLAGGFTSNSLLKTISVDKSFRSGLEFDATYKLNEHFTFTNSSSYMYAKFEGKTDNQSDGITSNSITLNGVEYSLINSKTNTYAKTENVTEKRTQLLTPNFIINQDVEYTLGHTFINVAARYLSKQYINLSNTETIPSYIIFNSKFGYKTKKYEVSVQLNNIFDKFYYTGGYESKSYFLGAPRSFYTTLKINI
jgi:outer membrane receptor protein involved in Fe transport